MTGQEVFEDAESMIDKYNIEHKDFSIVLPKIIAKVRTAGELVPCYLVSERKPLIASCHCEE